MAMGTTRTLFLCILLASDIGEGRGVVGFLTPWSGARASTPIHKKRLHRAAPIMHEGKSGAATSAAVVLDLEGVLYDGNAEVIRTAYRAASTKWPEVISKARDISPRDAGVRSSWVGGDFSSYMKDSGEDIPKWLEAKLSQVRPVASGPAEMVLAARLCVSEAVASSRNRDINGRRPLTAGEITENWEEMKDILYLRCGAEEHELLHLFQQERSEWMHSDEDGWLDACACGVYPGVAEFLEGAQTDKMYVLTCDLDKCTAQKVLERGGLKIPSERILECRPDEKSEVLLEVLDSSEQDAERGAVDFVEDDVSVLQQMAGDLRLASRGGRLRLHFAKWGHSTAKQVAAISAWPRVAALDDFDGLANLLLGGRGKDAGTQE